MAKDFWFDAIVQLMPDCLNLTASEAARLIARTTKLHPESREAFCACEAPSLLCRKLTDVSESFDDGLLSNLTSFRIKQANLNLDSPQRLFDRWPRINPAWTTREITA